MRAMKLHVVLFVGLQAAHAQVVPAEAKAAVDSHDRDPVLTTSAASVLVGTSGTPARPHVVRRYQAPASRRHAAPATLSAQQLPAYNVSYCSYWFALTTTVAPTAGARRASWLGNGWCLVVVFDTKTPRALWDSAMRSGGVRRSTTVLLTVEVQEAMAQHSDFIALLPWNHLARKNVAFLFAIRAGARLIFDFDDDNEISCTASDWPIEGLSVAPHPHAASAPARTSERSINALHLVNACTFLYDRSAGAAEAGKGSGLTINPYVALGANTSLIYPRGLPLNDVRDPRSQPSLVHVPKDDAIDVDPFVEAALKADPAQRQAGALSLADGRARLSSIGVVQSVADVDPDVDAIYRLASAPENAHTTFQGKYTSIIPQGLYAPLNAQATLHTQGALWATLLPTTVHGRVSDIWRGYIAQRLFFDAGLAVAFAVGNVTHRWTPHDLASDLHAEEPLHFRSEELLRFLRDWRCLKATGACSEPWGPPKRRSEMKEERLNRHTCRRPKHADCSIGCRPVRQLVAATLPLCFEQLWIALYEHGFIERDDVTIARLWQKELAAARYVLPPLLSDPVRGALERARTRFSPIERSGSGPNGGSCMQEPKSRAQYWRVAQPLSNSQRRQLVCEGLGASSASGSSSSVSPFCSSCSHPPVGMLPISSDPRAGSGVDFRSLAQPSRRVLVHSLMGAAHGNQLMCLMVGATFAALSGRQFLIAVSSLPYLSSASKRMYVDLIKQTFPRFDAVEVTESAWWQAWQANATTAASRTPNWVAELMSSILVVSTPFSCHKKWLSDSAMPAWGAADQWHGGDRRLLGSLGRPYCFQALPSRLNLYGSVAGQRFTSCALASLFGDVNVSSTAGQMAREVKAPILGRMDPSRPLLVVLHARAGNNVWSTWRSARPNQPDVRTRLRMEDYPWAAYFSCARTVVHSTLMAADRDGPVSWYIATDWNHEVLRQNASLVLQQNGDSLLPPIPGKAILSGGEIDHDDTWTREEWAAYRDGINLVLAEHIIMAQADLLLAARSSFSLTAAQISLLPAYKLFFGDALNGSQCHPSVVLTKTMHE